MNYFLVFLGGGLGSITRFAISRMFISQPNQFPVATLVSNSASSFILGLLLGCFFYKQTPNEPVHLLIATGFCGGFSTFSAFSYETFMLINAGHYKTALANIFLNLMVCYLAVAAGFFASRFF